jgi:hypothetical protein
MAERPRGSKEFQRLLQRHAAEIGQLPQRVMHLVRVGVVCAMLDDVRHDDGGRLFIVKGGTAMQLRLGIQARATTDLDVVFAGRVEDWLERFDAATADREWNGFTVSRKSEPTQIEVPGPGYRPWRVPLQIRYEGREFGSIALEVAVDGDAAEHHDLIAPDGIELAAFAINPPGLVPCLDVPNQIAQKLHACTEPLPDGNERVRDIIDIWLLEAVLESEEMSSLNAACLSTFRRRQKHTWPPVASPSPGWEREYSLLIAEYPGAPADVAAAIEYINDLVRRIDTAVATPR